jgi:DNA-binding LacI/PurR family transcriptional regulator
MAGWPHYDLTTFRQPIDTIVDVAITMIEDGSCAPGHAPGVRRISGELIKRGSTLGTVLA